MLRRLPRYRTGWRMRVAHRLSNRPLILVVDDFDGVRTLTTRALLRAGYHVLSASSHAEAIAVLDRLELQVSAAVIDLHFPGTPENQVTTELHRRQPNLPLIFLSAGGHDQDALLPGLLLEKPFSFRALCTILANLLALSAAGVPIHPT